ncbi:MAG: TnsA endonuclease N-terminal domain-containing protein [Scytonema sp. PMC 1069.18]|nr:TnsA endonuclease N-terminal domain-containing protein [Scytonema sp. PMC 1069.18]MEC4886552.1 TnsA endonuclease N-terminal domain-containing protein [Scytonema sp. PMC 1070.18]
MEHREDVLEYYDQPPPFKIQYTSASGRNLGVIITPDFFVIRSTSAGWVECKTEQELEKLAQKSPHRYQRDTNNKWQSPPGLEYAQQFGFDFLLWSSAKINWTLQRNLEFLEDYYKSDLSIKLDEHCNIVMSLVEAHPGISVAKLLDYKGVNADTIYSLIATEKIYVDLTAHLLVEANKCQVFKSRVVENALKAIIYTENVDQMITPIVDIIPGTSVVYDGVNLNIILVGQDYLLLSAKEFETIELKISEFFALVNSGKIQINPLKNHLLMYEQAMEILKRASTEDLINANRRFNLLKPYLDGEAVGSISKERSLRRWLYNYRQAQQKYGYGYLGLISLNNRKGNRNRKLPPQVLEILEKFITEEYESKKQKTKQSVYASFIHSCLNSGITNDQIPSYKTFINEIKKRPKHSQVEKRSGNRAAYEMSEFYWELELSTPRHGDFPFHIAHLDHTELDIELRCSKTGKVLGRPWLTLLVDAFTRRILAIYVSYDPPSYRSCMMALRICVQRYSRLPQIIVTDNGKEFYSTYFETLLAIFECTLKRRPPAKPRFSSVCERLFGTTNTQFLYNLAGNTQITKKVRLMTKSVNPKNLSVWTLGLLYMYLTEWAYSIYDTTEHPALQGQSPQEVFTTGINQFGSRNGRLIPYDENFRILTLPTTKKGKALVQPGKGIKIDNKYYWHQIFRDPQVEKTLVNVRYDPFNAGVAYAYIQGLWVECISEYYPLFRGHSEKEIQLATAELKKQMRLQSLVSELLQLLASKKTPYIRAITLVF